MPEASAGDNLSDLHKFYSAFEKRQEYKAKSTPSSLEFNVVKPKPKLVSNRTLQPETQVAGDTTITVHGPESDIKASSKDKQATSTNSACTKEKEASEGIKFVYSPPRETQSPERLLDSSTDSVPPSESSIESSQTCISSLESSSHSPPLEESSVFSEKEPDPSKKEKRVEFVGVKPSSELEDNQSYEVRVVGGLVQKIPVRESPSGSPVVKRRPKPSRSRVDRRVSCKDLGKGDCEGWLFKRKSKPSLRSHWQRRWCVIKDYNLFCYHDREALKAEVVMHLPAFQISPVDTSELKTKKYAFKIHNSGTSFLFASDRQEDRTKWMNKMGLAAIAFHNNRDSIESKKSDISRDDEAYSESENEEDPGHMSDGSGTNSPKVEHRKKAISSSSLAATSSLGLSVPKGDILASQEDLSKLLRRQSQRGENIFGENKMKQRKSAISRDLDDHSSPELLKYKRLKSLERTLKAKEKELSELDDVLQGKSLSKLHMFGDVLNQSNMTQDTDSE